MSDAKPTGIPQMNSREIVQRTLDVNNPPRVARSFEDSDFRSAAFTTETYQTPWKEVSPGRSERLPLTASFPLPFATCLMETRHTPLVLP